MQPVNAGRFFKSLSSSLAGARLSFPSTTKMMDHLTTLSPAERSSIFELRVKAFPFPVYSSEEGIYSAYHTYHFHCILGLFPELSIHRLVVQDVYSSTYDGWSSAGTLNELKGLLWSDGWSKLYFISQTPSFLRLGPSLSDDPSFDEAVKGLCTISDLKKGLKERDGSSADLQCFISTHEFKEGIDIYNEEGMMMGDRWRELTCQEDLNTIEETDAPNPVMVVANRGNNQDVSVKAHEMIRGESLSNLHRLFKEMSWQEIKESGLLLDGEDDPSAHL